MSEVTKVVVFGAFGIALGSVIEWILHRVESPIPYTVLVFYIGIIFAVICKVLGIATGRYLDDSEVSSSIILYGLLPTLLFSETMHINLLHFRQSFLQSVTLAGPGGVIVACQLALCSYWCLPFNWSWNYNFLFGSIMCATDPVSVVSLLKSAKASSSLSTIIAGESLMNDGSAMILYFFFFNMINGTVYTVGTFIAFLAEMLILSPLIGIIVGVICFYCTRRTSRPTDLHIDFQIMFCFAAAYGSYYIAGALLEISGVLACCGAGVTVAVLVNPSIVEHERMHEVWHYAEWVCNTLIFLLGGFIGGQHTYKNFSVVNVLLLLVMYVLLTATRAVMLTVLFPAVSNIGMKMTIPDAVFVTAAGLRGALAIALALDASRNADNNNDSEVGGQFFFIVTGLVSMTLLLNGSTAGQLLLWLKLVEDPNAPMSVQKTMVLLRIKDYMKLLVKNELQQVQGELGDYDEEEVARLCQLQHSEYGDFAIRATIAEYAASFSEPADKKKIGGGGDSKHNANSEEQGSNQSSQATAHSPGKASLQATLSQELVVFARKALLDVVRARYMHCIHTGKIGNSVMASKILLYSVDVAVDKAHISLSDWECIEASLTPNNSLIWLARNMDSICVAMLGLHPGLLGYVDAFNERNALYVLINYIDAHEYALNRLNFILGMDDIADENGSGSESVNGSAWNSSSSSFDGRAVGGSITASHLPAISSARPSHVSRGSRSVATDFSRLEAHQVILEASAMIEKAKHLLTLINAAHLKKVYTHRAARIILIKQEEILHRLVGEGVLSDTLAHTLFKTLSDESDRINLERASHDRHLIKDTRRRKVEEDIELRESMHAGSTHASAHSVANAMSTNLHGNNGLGSVLANPSSPPESTVRSDSVDNPNLYTQRPSLRAHLTGDDNMRASFTAGAPRAPAAPPAARSPTSGYSPRSATTQTQKDSVEKNSGDGDGESDNTTHSPLNHT